MPRKLEDFAVFAAPGVFVLLWASGFVGAKLGLGYAEPLTFLSLRMIAVVALLALIIAVTRPKWPNATGIMHSAVDRAYGARASISAACLSPSRTAFRRGLRR